MRKIEIDTDWVTGRRGGGGGGGGRRGWEGEEEGEIVEGDGRQGDSPCRWLTSHGQVEQCLLLLSSTPRVVGPALPLLSLTCD